MSSKVQKNLRRRLDVSDKTRIAEQAVQLVRYLDKWAGTEHEMCQVRSIALYPPASSRNGQWLVVARSWCDGQKLVAFYRAPDPLTALVGFFAKWHAGKLEFKLDKFSD